jgi:hypothetical protein
LPGCLTRSADRAKSIIGPVQAWLCILPCKRGRQIAEGVRLLLQVLRLLLGDGDDIGAGDEATRRLLLAGDRDEGARELGGVAGLLAVHALVPLHSLCMTVGVVVNGRRRVGRRLLGQEIGAEEPRVDDGGGDAEGRDLGLERLHPALQGRTWRRRKRN